MHSDRRQYKYCALKRCSSFPLSKYFLILLWKVTSTGSYYINCVIIALLHPFISQKLKRRAFLKHECVHISYIYHVGKIKSEPKDRLFLMLGLFLSLCLPVCLFFCLSLSLSLQKTFKIFDLYVKLSRLPGIFN